MTWLHLTEMLLFCTKFGVKVQLCNASVAEHWRCVVAEGVPFEK